MTIFSEHKPLHKVLTLLWMGLLTAGILSNPMISYPGRDSGIFLYIGSLILKGKIPYRDVWENKGPLVFYINALGLALTGGSRWGIWLLEFVFLFAASYIGYLTLKKLMGVIPAIIGTFIAVSAAGNVLQGGNFSEEYSLLFSFMAIFFFLKSIEEPGSKIHNIIIGATLGLNILLRPNNISAQAAIAGAYFLMAIFDRNWRQFIHRAIQIALGMLILLIPALLYFAAHDSLIEMFNVVIVFNAQYSEGGGLARVMEGVVNAARGIGIPLAGVAALGYILALYFIFQRNALDTPRGKFLLVLVIGLPLEAFLSGLSGKNYPHYFIGWALYVGLFGGYAAQVLSNQFNLKAERTSALLIVFLILFALGARLDTWKGYAAVFRPNTQVEYRDALVEYIQKNTAPEDTVLVWGFRPIINFAARRQSPASYLPYPLSHVETPLARRWADEYYEQLTANPPVLIVNMIEPADRERIPDLDPEIRKQYKIKWKDVVLAHNYKATIEFIQQNYTRVDSVNGNDIYRLK